ncbi:MAG: GGDEF domain-containing protein [Sedimentisphaerales bacterium]|nr:GGDEF domain-containing protein [Sedimentisphaerales bacterium]
MMSSDSSDNQNNAPDKLPENRKILLVGDINKAFIDVGNVTRERYEFCPDILDAVETAADNDFAGIGIVMAGISTKLSPVLKELRGKNDARIILLAQMYEEPIAMYLVGSAADGKNSADDYLICPVHSGRFYKSVMTAEVTSRSKTATPVDMTIEDKIKHLEKLATEDDLTGLKNRRYIWEFSRQIIERAAKENKRVTLLVFDIDNFKKYNDIYGHSVGDEVLKQAAVLIKRCCRSHDVIGRIGGDEFAVVFWDEPFEKKAGTSDERRSTKADHPTEAIHIAKRFVKELENSELTPLAGLGNKGKGILTISGGLASFPRDGSTIQELFMQADKALLEAKRSGKNKIHLVGKPQSDITSIP